MRLAAMPAAELQETGRIPPNAGLLVSYAASLAARPECGFEPFARRYGYPHSPITGYSPAFSLAQLPSIAFGSYVLLWHLPEALHRLFGRRGDEKLGTAK